MKKGEERYIDREGRERGGYKKRCDKKTKKWREKDWIKHGLESISTHRKLLQRKRGSGRGEVEGRVKGGRRERKGEGRRESEEGVKKEREKKGEGRRGKGSVWLREEWGKKEEGKGREVEGHSEKGEERKG